MPFTLDERLEKSSFHVANLGVCGIYLKNDKTFPWLYLIPHVEGMREIHDLSSAHQHNFIEAVALASKAVSTIYQAYKMNVAALGNVVPQLHVHIMARYEGDIAWNGPVWRVNWEEKPYADHEKDAEIRKLKAYFDQNWNGG